MFHLFSCHCEGAIATKAISTFFRELPYHLRFDYITLLTYACTSRQRDGVRTDMDTLEWRPGHGVSVAGLAGEVFLSEDGFRTGLES